MHIIKTTAAISTKICTVTKTTKCPSRVHLVVFITVPMLVISLEMSILWGRKLSFLIDEASRR